jgi:hypothetical protein
MTGEPPMMISLALMSGLVLGVASASRLPASDTTVSCPQTPAENLLPSVVGPMAGFRPAWFVDGGGAMLWEHAAHPVKTLWVVSRTSAPVRITGNRVDGPGTAKFRQGQDQPIDEFVIADPSHASVIPGGASAEVMRGYSFIPSHVFYSSPGCWEFTVQVGSDVVRLVREIKAR